MENELQKQIDELKREILQLKRSNTIPRDIEMSFSQRLKIHQKLEGSGLSTAPTQTLAVSSTPTNIIVPAQPSGSITVEFDGQIYNLLYV
jgi:hypothetical protein